MSEKLVLIDGHSILNRAYFGIPDLTNAQGVHTNAVYGFLNILFKILEEEKPQYLTVAFDVHAPTFRHKMYDAYKGTRKPMAEELRQQVPIMKDMLRAMGVPVIEQEGYEADDLLGTLAKQSEAEGVWRCRWYQETGICCSSPQSISGSVYQRQSAPERRSRITMRLMWWNAIR